MDYETEEMCCKKCSTVLMEPYIQCVECSSIDKEPVFLCLHCFAKGVEFEGHQSDHPYTVIKHNFHLFERHWTAVEEKQLLKAVADSGYGNWLDVAHQVGTKTHTECERHYNSCYIDNPAPGLPEFPDPELDTFPCPIVYKLSEDPPRPADHSLINSEMAGYMAGRGDFMTEYDNYMELDLRNLEFDREVVDTLETDLKLTVLDVYQRCLKERQRRKRLIRKYGLINIQKLSYFQRRFERTIKHLLDGLRVFTQLIHPQDFDMYLESLHYECELKNDIRSLQECYANQVKRLNNISMFKMLKSCREKERQNRHLLNDVLHHLKDETACQSWLQRQATMESLGKGASIALPNAPRKSAPPLDVSGLPGYDKITDRERELCAHIRLVPEAYVEFKRTLVTECMRMGSLKLAQARSLIKIDVNKTRKIYDFLFQEGMINKDRK